MTDTNFKTLEVALADKSLNTFRDLLIADGVDIGPLWKAWHFLQVYSIWGLHLPNSEESLKNSLKIEDPGAYDFFAKMLESYKKININSSGFTKNVFPKVVKIGEQIKAFGQDAATNQDGAFTAIIKLVNDKSTESEALELIIDLRKRSNKNAQEAKEVTKLLTDYNTSLNDAQKLLKTTSESIENDDKVSQNQIDLINGGPEVEGSLAYIQDQLDTTHADYEHYMLVAATSPSYSFVLAPIGTVAAAIVAGIFGAKAIEALNLYDQIKATYDTAENAVKLAIKAHEVHSMAKTGVDNAKRYTEFAINQMSLVEHAWEDVSKSLDLIFQKLEKMTKTLNQEERLKSKSQIKNYARRCGDSWMVLWPAIEQLTTDPYITVDVKERNIQEIIEEINNAIANQSTDN